MKVFRPSALPSGRPHLVGHSLLRGVAAITVFMAHAEFASLWPGGTLSFFQDRLLFWHNEAVDLFFVLSGFILLYVHPPAAGIRWRSYLAARAARIYPLYLVSTVVTIALFFAGSLKKGLDPLVKTPSSLILENLLGIQQWTLDRGFATSINTPSWSVSVELLLYISLFPLLWTFLRKTAIGGAVSWILCLLCLLSNGFLYLFEAHFPAGAFLILRGITAFAGGAFFYRALEAGAARPPARALLIFSLVLFASSALQVVPRVWLALCSIPLLYCISQSNEFFRSPRLSKPCLMLGEMSFGIYLLHYPVTKATRLLTGVWIMDSHYDPGVPALQKALFLFLTVFTVFGGAYLSYRFFENPARKWLRTRLSAKRTPLGA